MKLKEGFVLRQVCGENVITGEGRDGSMAVERGRSPE